MTKRVEVIRASSRSEAISKFRGRIKKKYKETPSSHVTSNVTIRRGEENAKTHLYYCQAKTRKRKR